MNTKKTAMWIPRIMLSVITLSVIVIAATPEKVAGQGCEECWHDFVEHHFDTHGEEADGPYECDIQFGCHEDPLYGTCSMNHLGCAEEEQEDVEQLATALEDPTSPNLSRTLTTLASEGRVTYMPARKVLLLHGHCSDEFIAAFPVRGAADDILRGVPTVQIADH